jgi:hypothetical protein
MTEGLISSIIRRKARETNKFIAENVGTIVIDLYHDGGKILVKL